MAEYETAAIPDLSIRSKIFTRGMSGANMNLQMSEWSYKDCFAGSLIDEDTGESMEYRDLIKKDKYLEVWNTLFAN